jgi:hypothetical protein
MGRFALSPIAALAPFALLALLTSGCGYSMHEYHVAGYAPITPAPADGPPPKAQWIRARAEQNVVLGITDNTDYVNVAYDRLVQQCSGDIVALNTRYSTKLGFLSYTNTIDVQALCLP